MIKKKEDTEMTTFDFGPGPVPAHKHSNGGGWVADTAYVADTAFIGPDALVYDTARVYGDAKVSGAAWVNGTAEVFDTAQIYGNAQVFDTAQVYGNALVYSNALVSVTPPRASRSDGYDFIAVPCADGQVRVIAGCRCFTFEEAYAHWTATRGGTPQGEETIDILDFLKTRASRRGSYEWVDIKSPR